jgi:hypothetical protein
MFICPNCLKEFDDQDEFFEHYTAWCESGAEEAEEYI